jgi:hypothetical protein
MLVLLETRCLLSQDPATDSYYQLRESTPDLKGKVVPVLN